MKIVAEFNQQSISFTYQKNCNFQLFCLYLKILICCVCVCLWASLTNEYYWIAFGLQWRLLFTTLYSFSHYISLLSDVNNKTVQLWQVVEQGIRNSELMSFLTARNNWNSFISSIFSFRTLDNIWKQVKYQYLWIFFLNFLFYLYLQEFC